MPECSVLPGIYGLLVQGTLFASVCFILVLKKQFTKNERTWKEFGLDSSKQIFGSGWIHCMNLASATVLDRLMENGDQCEWYWINIVVDTTIGVVVAWLLLKFFLGLLSKCGWEEEFKQGEYYEEGTLKWPRYLKQLALWLVVVTCMKLTMVGLMLACSEMLQAAASAVLQPFMQNPSLKLIVVMIVTPLCMNALQFWVVDNFIKKQEAVIDENEYQKTGDSDTNTGCC